MKEMRCGPKINISFRRRQSMIVFFRAGIVLFLPPLSDSRSFVRRPRRVLCLFMSSYEALAPSPPLQSSPQFPPFSSSSPSPFDCRGPGAEFDRNFLSPLPLPSVSTAVGEERKGRECGNDFLQLFYKQRQIGVCCRISPSPPPIFDTAHKCCFGVGAIRVVFVWFNAPPLSLFHG